MTPHSIIQSVFLTLKYEYISENETEFKNILTHWSEAEAGSNDEKTRGPKYRWTVPLSGKKYDH